MNRPMTWIGKVDAKAIYGSLHLSNEATERAIVAHVAPTLGSLALGVGLYLMSTGKSVTPFAVAAFALPAAISLAALALAPGRRAAGAIWFAPLAMASVYLAARTEIMSAVGVAFPLAALAIVIGTGAILVHRRLVSALDLAFALLFAPAALAGPQTSAAVRALLGDGAVAALLFTLILTPALVTMAARRQLFGTAAAFAALGGWSLLFSPGDSWAPGAALVAAALAAGVTQFLVKPPAPQSDVRLFADSFLFASVLLVGLVLIADAAGGDAPAQWAIRAWAVLVVGWQIANAVRKPSGWPIAAAIGWSALTAFCLSFIAWPWPRPPAPALAGAAALGVVALAGVIFLASWRLRVTDLMKAYFACFAAGALFVFVTHGLKDTIVNGLAPPAAPADPALLALGLAAAAISPFIMQLKTEAAPIATWRGFVTPRTAARLRRFFKIVGQTVQRLPFVSSFGALASIIWTMLQHLRGRNGTPVMSEIVLVLVTLVLARIFAHLPPLDFLVDAQGAPTDAAHAESVARAVAFGVTLFIVGATMGSRFFTYFGLAAIASPVLVLTTGSSFGSMPTSAAPLDAARIGGTCLAMAAGLLTCEFVRLVASRMQLLPQKARA